MDEYVGIKRIHPESYHSFMYGNFFSHVAINPENINLLDGNAGSLAEECLAYEAKIKAFGGIELFLGGVGGDGHIAFNEPGSSLASHTRVKSLAYGTISNGYFYLVTRIRCSIGNRGRYKSHVHPIMSAASSLVVVDEDAILELKIKTVKVCQLSPDILKVQD
ncbi:uncharacterized protein TRUGW13939_05611 [Talaromyces rugulosus]|uniref:Uncharacterized protein n=1 Tax=Talaromyces rugulosus TaxID=121627 RepID=A0A7H8QX32_TALRU|nr:uncharacterized protein TRUGW13939_05611 [Talaromyces rugulosus]QKX58487.1 hypothetical protein TRUGW13939_05611 [Talaromyces rugulosus]